MGLHYSSRHLNRMLPGFNRLVRLRRRIGADPRPFTPIAARPWWYKRFWRIAGEIRQLEERLVGHLRVDVNDALERRVKLHGMLPE